MASIEALKTPASARRRRALGSLQELSQCDTARALTPAPAANWRCDMPAPIRSSRIACRCILLPCWMALFADTIKRSKERQVTRSRHVTIGYATVTNSHIMCGRRASFPVIPISRGASFVTVVVGVATHVDGFIVADCQVTGPNGKRRDYCQKVIVANAWSVVGIAGDLCLARHLVGGIVNRLRETDFDQQGWLREDREIARFVFEGILDHDNQHPDHVGCTDRGAELLVLWSDYKNWSDTTGWAGPPIPNPRVAAIRVFDGQVQIERVGRGVGVIGRNRAFQRELNDENFDRGVTHFNRFGSDPDVQDAHRALVASTVIRKRLIENNRMRGVGGLFQIATMSANGIQTVPYFQLVDVVPGYRTYVAIRIEDGFWVQEHRPTRRKVRVVSPFEIDPFGPIRTESLFDPTDWLTPESPGVIPAQEWETVFSLYNPPAVPPAIVPSWGDAPLAPLTYGDNTWWEEGDKTRWVVTTQAPWQR